MKVRKFFSKDAAYENSAFSPRMYGSRVLAAWGGKGRHYNRSVIITVV